MLPFAIARTVDYSDLIALPAVALGAWSAHRVRVWRFARSARVGLAIAAPLAFAATSVPPRYLTRGVAAVNDAGASELQRALHEVAERHGLECRRCDALLDDGLVFERRRHALSLVASFDPVAGGLYYQVAAQRHGAKAANACRRLEADLLSMLARRFPGIAVQDAPGWRIENATLLIDLIDAAEAATTDDVLESMWRIVENEARAHGLRPDEEGARILYAGRLLGPTVRDRELVVWIGPHIPMVYVVRVRRRLERYQAAEQALLSELESALRVAFPAARIRVNREPGWRGGFD